MLIWFNTVMSLTNVGEFLSKYLHILYIYMWLIDYESELYAINSIKKNPTIYEQWRQLRTWRVWLHKLLFIFNANHTLFMSLSDVAPTIICNCHITLVCVTHIFNIVEYEPSNSSVDTVSATDVSCHAG